MHLQSRVSRNLFRVYSVPVTQERVKLGRTHRRREQISRQTRAVLGVPVRIIRANLHCAFGNSDGANAQGWVERAAGTEAAKVRDGECVEAERGKERRTE